MDINLILLAIRDNKFEYGDIINFHLDGDLVWYIKHQGLCEIGFKYRGEYKESAIKNTISINSWREAIKKGRMIVDVCKEVQWTVFADVYDKDSYTPKREKVARILGLSKGFVGGVKCNNCFKA